MAERWETTSVPTCSSGSLSVSHCDKRKTKTEINWCTKLELLPSGSPPCPKLSSGLRQLKDFMTEQLHCTQYSTLDGRIKKKTSIPQRNNSSNKFFLVKQWFSNCVLWHLQALQQTYRGWVVPSSLFFLVLHDSSAWVSQEEEASAKGHHSHNMFEGCYSRR